MNNVHHKDQIQKQTTTQNNKKKGQTQKYLKKKEKIGKFYHKNK